MNRTQLVLRRAAPYACVAFDVFDTLIRRDVAAPTDLFRLRGPAFADARLQAEREARAAQTGEVTLAAIYARPCLAGYDPADECAAELAAAVPDLELLRAARILHEKGRRLYAVSDMYLPAEQIRAMLDRCGYGFLDGVYVSSTYGVQKRSGALFRTFLQKEGLDARDVLFVGDDWRADVAGAALAGIRALHLPATQLLPTTPRPQGVAPGAAHAFTQNRLPLQRPGGEALGFEVLGLMCVAFCRWLHQKRQERPGAALYFLARDMYLMRAVYGILYPDENTHYLRVSRRSLCPALLARGDDAAAAEALPRQSLTGAQIAAYCGTTCPPEKAGATWNLKDPSARAALPDFLRALPAQAEGDLALAYLRQQGLRAGDILVDIGSGGTTQWLLERLLGAELNGLLLACDARVTGKLPDRAQAFLFDGQPAPRLYWAGQPMLERLISQDVGATLGYACTEGTQQIAVRTGQQSPQPLIVDLQRGALRFASAWRGSVLADLALPPDYAVSAFLHLVAAPTADQVRLLGGLTVEDGGVYPLAKPETPQHYLAHPAQAKRDLMDARWKIGFLKAAAPLPLPYDKLYLLLKDKK